MTVAPPSSGASEAPWVLVTGGARRLGRAFCLAFARAGWRVLCHHHTSEAEARETRDAVQALGRACVPVRQDLAAPESADALLDACQAEAGALPRCIVNNASIFDADTAPTADAEHLLAHLRTNTVAPLLLGNRLAARLDGAQAAPGRHSVIHVLDQKVHNLNPDYFSYTVSKLALERSVALQAQALAPRVRVCGLSPGLLYLSGPQTQDNFDRASRVNLLGQPIDPADVARAAVFMAENDSITGSTLQVDNGQHLVPLARDVMFAVGEEGKP
ncbi:MAG: SDR family oxidoreductase [Ottowia sp.]|uniref:SDR family oxidoreductase n=1 Tax=Ottowia sp. TaxID=1898956 RepID=UPI0039E23171